MSVEGRHGMAHTWGGTPQMPRDDGRALPAETGQEDLTPPQREGIGGTKAPGQLPAFLLKALEQSMKVEQTRAMPQRRQRTYEAAGVIAGALLIWLILASDIQPSGSNYTSPSRE